MSSSICRRINRCTGEQINVSKVDMLEDRFICQWIDRQIILHPLRESLVDHNLCFIFVFFFICFEKNLFRLIFFPIEMYGFMCQQRFYFLINENRQKLYLSLLFYESAYDIVTLTPCPLLELMHVWIWLYLFLLNLFHGLQVI